MLFTKTSGLQNLCLNFPVTIKSLVLSFLSQFEMSAGKQFLVGNLYSFNLKRLPVYK